MGDRIRQKDPGYLTAQGMTLLDLATDHPVDPATVPWEGMTGRLFNARYPPRQEPGPLNALGRVKFMFPSPYHVYLHDTPSRQLFQRAERSFSHGCIRVERPLDLATYLLRGDSAWSRDRIDSVVREWKETTVMLPEPIEVHVQYLTAWVSEGGVLHFRRDLYGRDARVWRALTEPPPEQ